MATRNTVRHSRGSIHFWLILWISLAACQPSTLNTLQPEKEPESMPATSTSSEEPASLIPIPAEFTPAQGVFRLNSNTRILLSPDRPDIRQVGEYLAGCLRPATGFELPVLAADKAAKENAIMLSLPKEETGLGDEGYQLTVSPGSIEFIASQPAGLFYGAQTLRQLLPANIESSDTQPGPWEIPAGTIRDQPRFAWRGLMLDVSRHFFGVGEIKHVIDWMAAYKLNRLHLHLTDDQGWRIEIKSWPKLATYGGSSEVGGGRGGYYTQADYAEIIAYAQSRYILLIPEFDMPGHINAALASYPELNCDEIAPPLYTGTEVGFSTFCIHKEITYRFLDEVVGELASLTPGPFIHIGGDETAATKPEDYLYFIERVQGIVRSHGKQVIGWEEVAQARLLEDTIVQQWHDSEISNAVPQGVQIILSPSKHAYLDMKYDENTPLGLSWAGYVSLEDAYAWEPAAIVPGLPEARILGIEAPLWTETLRDLDDIAYMVFPRLPGLAEIAWSPAQGRNWNEYQLRLAAHGSRMEALQINFYRSPDIPWK